MASHLGLGTSGWVSSNFPGRRKWPHSRGPARFRRKHRCGGTAHGRATSLNFFLSQATGSLACFPALRLRPHVRLRIRDLAEAAEVKGPVFNFCTRGSCQASRGQRRGGLGYETRPCRGAGWVGARQGWHPRMPMAVAGSGWGLLGVAVVRAVEAAGSRSQGDKEQEQQWFKHNRGPATNTVHY